MFDTEEQRQKILQIFFPFLLDRQSYVKQNNIRLVHYTTAQTAASIIKNKTFWMRDYTCMNDVSEVEHGIDCLIKAYNNEDGSDGELKQALNSIAPDAANEVEKLFNKWMGDIRDFTYMTCFSEHYNKEDVYGRLSMWRAYGGDTGVAIVVNNAPFFLESELEIYASPVEYLDRKMFKEKLDEITKNIISNADFLRKLDKKVLARAVCTMFRFAALCTKHPAFEEEIEWRIICSPTIDDVSELLQPEVEIIKGVPQIVYKIALENKPEIDLIGIEFPDFIDRIIIGPTQYPFATYKAFVELLVNAGVSNAGEKVIMSNIPLRV